MPSRFYYEDFDNHPYDDDYIYYLIYLIVDEADMSNELGIKMYEQTNRIEPLIIYAYAENHLMQRFSQKTLEELIKRVDTESKDEILCALMLLISTYYNNREFAGHNENLLLYYLNKSLEFFGTPYALRKLGQYKEMGGKNKDADVIFYKIAGYLHLSGERLETHNLETPERIALAYRIYAVNFFKEIKTSNMIGERSDDVNFNTSAMSIFLKRTFLIRN